MSIHKNHSSKFEGFSIASMNYFDVVAIFGVISVGPLFWQHMQNLSSLKHFQFFPIAWLLFAVFVYTRGEIGPMKSRGRFALGTVVLILAICVSACSVTLLSPWLSHLGLLFLSLSWMLLRLGGTKLPQVFAWLSLIAITLPLPMSLDTKLIQQLQIVSTESSSSVLELLSTPHLTRGNVLEIKTGELFVDEACSGVDGLYSLAAIALMLVIWQQRSFASSVLTLVTVPLWAWLGNLVRITLIAFLLDRYGVDLSSGWQHTFLGLCMFACSFSFLLLTQAAVAELLTEFPGDSITSNAFHDLFNSVVSWPKTDSKQNVRSKILSSIEPVGSLWGTRLVTSTAFFAFFVIGGFSFLPSVGSGRWKTQMQALPSISEANVKSLYSEVSLPTELGGMTRLGFSTSHRETGSFFGEHSATWQYSDGELVLQVSLDFPFAGFHHLEECYRLSGQQILGSWEVSSRGTDSSPVITEVSMVDQLGVESYLWYVNLDKESRAITPFASALGRGIVADGGRTTAYQMQIFAPGCGELTKLQRERFSRSLAEVVSYLAPNLPDLVN